MDDYNLQNQLKYTQKDLYRYRAEGHNLIVINPADKADRLEQPAGKYIPIKGKDANEYGGCVYADMTEAYEDDVNKMLMGYYIGDNMQTVTARYEMDLKKGIRNILVYAYQGGYTDNRECCVFIKRRKVYGGCV